MKTLINFSKSILNNSMFVVFLIFSLVITFILINPSGNKNNKASETFLSKTFDEEYANFLSSDSIELGQENFLSFWQASKTYPEKFTSKKIAAVGYIEKDDKIAVNLFYIARKISLSKDDVRVAKVLCDYSESSDLTAGKWVSVKGTGEVIEENGVKTFAVKVQTTNTISHSTD